MESDELTALFKKIIKVYDIQKLLDVLSENTSGNLYLVGGFVYRSIALKLQGLHMETMPDLDFVTDKIEIKNIPADWMLGKNRYGGLKIHTQKFSIDIDEFKHHVNINYLNLPQTIESYLEATPLNIQSIAFDVKNKKIIGDVGIKSLNDKEIGVSNIKIFDLEREKRIQKIISKSKDLNFTPILPKNEKARILI
ncbi:hypothetical protein HYV79_00575 [Candidatus Woesearchaeota archaeon]|nr:hypothetical protein [Candidatus Woesearchaeota archaeon]